MARRRSSIFFRLFNYALKKISHKEHKEYIGREARKIKFLRPLSFDVAQDGESVEPRTLRLNVFFDCGCAALDLTYPALLDYLQMHYG